MPKNKKYTSADQIVDETLKISPDYQLPDNFADTLMQKFETNFAWNSYLKEFFIYLAVIFGIISTTGAMTFFLMKETWGNWLNVFFENIGSVIGIIFLLVFILFTDKVLLRYFSKKTVSRVRNN